MLWRGVAAQNRAKIGVAFLSVVFCVPVLALVVLLLADADAVFWETLTGLFSGEGPAWPHVLRVALTVVVALMFFSWLTVLRMPKRDRRASSTGLSIPAMFPAILLPMLNVVYALFTYIQFSNLFGGAAHAAMAGGYAEYARSGFFQLVLVAGINLIVLAVAIHASRGPWMRTMSALLIAATAVLLVSAFWRMRLYILAFGMTVLRALFRAVQREAHAPAQRCQHPRIRRAHGRPRDCRDDGGRLSRHAVRRRAASAPRRYDRSA